MKKAAGWYFHNWYDDGYHYFHGDFHIVLNGIDRKDDLTVVCRVCNPTDLFILMQVGDILIMAGLSTSLLMISAANTVENLLGCVVLGLVVAISVETKCLTTIKLRKHEK